MKLNLRDLFWLALVVALSLCWWLSERRNSLLRLEAEQKIKSHDAGWMEIFVTVRTDEGRPNDAEIKAALRRFEEREAKEGWNTN